MFHRAYVISNADARQRVSQKTQEGSLPTNFYQRANFAPHAGVKLVGRGGVEPP